MAVRRHTPDLDLPGRTLAHYRVIERLGRGGMGEVYLAEDLRLGRRVALKVLFPELAAEPHHVERFEREARSVAALNHPNIVTLHAVEKFEGLHFLVMELVEGKTLADLLASRGPFPLEELLDISLALTSGLEIAHARGIVHRDLKPWNVMVTNEGRVKILDFGVARILDPEEEILTRSDVVVGTVHYMAPEQIQGQPVDPRTDLFSLGIVLFEMATGRRPFQGPHGPAILASILSDTPPPVSSLRPDLPPRLDEILALCLAKEPFLRYRSATSLHADLADLARSNGLDLGSTLESIRPLRKRAESVRWNRLAHAPRLPAAPRCFGREREAGELVDALCAEPPPPVPILGPAGAGKSTIALAAMHHPRVGERFGKRRFFVRCDGATGRDSLVAAIARLICPEAQQPLEPGLFLELEEAPAVLALDNFETPWEQDTAAVEELLAELAAVPGLALLVTLRGEQRPIGPGWRKAIHAGPLDPESARTVFLSVAGEHFRDDPDLDPLLLELDGLALAVVLLASQAEGEPGLSVLRQRWRDQRTALLHRGGGRERQHSWKISLEISIDSPRMTEESRRLLFLLGLLPEGVAHEDIAALLPRDGAEAASVLRKVGLAFDQGTRLRVLAPIRESVQQSHPPPAEDFDRAIDHYLALARLGEKIGGEGGAKAADRLRADMGNLEPMILAGLERADPIPAIHSALAYTEAVRFTGIGGLSLLEKARQAARKESRESLEADCFRKGGDVHLYRAGNEPARAMYENARELYRKIGNPHGEACCTASLAEVHLFHSQPTEARRLYEEARTRFQALGDSHGEAQCLLGLGSAAFGSDISAARDHLQAARILYHQAGDLRGEANCLQRLAQVSVIRNEFEAARPLCEEARSLFRRAGSLLGEALCITHLGSIALEQSDPRSARRHLQRALALNRRAGALRGEANCLRLLGHTEVVLRHPDRAALFFEAAIARFQRVGPVTGVADCHEGLGEIALARSDVAAARIQYGQALSMFLRIPDQVGIGRAHLALARASSPGSAERHEHIEAARQAWEAAGILEEMRSELSAVSPA